MSKNTMNKPLARLALCAAMMSAASSVPAAAELAFMSSGSNPTSLYALDLDTNEAFFLLDFGSADKYHAITICPGRDTLFAIGKNPANVVAVDLGSPVPTENVLGSLPGRFNNWVVQLSCALDGTLYFTNTQTDELYTLDPLTCPLCAPDLVGVIETSPGAGDVDVAGADIEFTGTGDLFLLTNREGRGFYQLDPGSGLATKIGEVAIEATNTGMTGTSGDRLIIHSNDDHLYSINRENAATTDLGVVTEEGIDFLHQGGDLAAPIPICVCKPKKTQDDNTLIRNNNPKPKRCKCLGTCETAFESWLR